MEYLYDLVNFDGMEVCAAGLSVVGAVFALKSDDREKLAGLKHDGTWIAWFCVELEHQKGAGVGRLTYRPSAAPTTLPRSQTRRPRRNVASTWPVSSRPSKGV